MNTPSDRSARAFAVLAAALGITIGVAPEVLFAQSTAQPPAIEQQKGAVQQKGAAQQRKDAVQQKGSHTGAAQVGARQNKANQYPVEHDKLQPHPAGRVGAVQHKGELPKGQQLKGQQLKGQQLKGQQLKGAQVKGSAR